jgi:hypothetical protein
MSYEMKELKWKNECLNDRNKKSWKKRTNICYKMNTKSEY